MKQTASLEAINATSPYFVSFNERKGVEDYLEGAATRR
jgi:hypothetical protein